MFDCQRRANRVAGRFDGSKVEDRVEAALSRSGLMVGPRVTHSGGGMSGESKDGNCTIPKRSPPESLANMLSRYVGSFTDVKLLHGPLQLIEVSSV